MRISTFLIPAGLWALCGLHAAGAAERPELVVPAAATSLRVVAQDPQSWNGQRIPKTQQCLKNGGQAPVRSPVLQVSAIPAGTQRLVVYFSNPRAHDNHGLFSLPVPPAQTELEIPALASGARKLPPGLELFQGGSSWGAAYNAPCPSNGSWRYGVTVYALAEAERVLAVGELDLGWSE